MHALLPLWIFGFVFFIYTSGSTWLRYYTVNFALLSKGVKLAAHNGNRWLLRAFVNGNNGKP